MVILSIDSSKVINIYAPKFLHHHYTLGTWCLHTAIVNLSFKVDMVSLVKKKKKKNTSTSLFNHFNEWTVLKKD
jgi:hypothetical protein